MAFPYDHFVKSFPNRRDFQRSEINYGNLKDHFIESLTWVISLTFDHVFDEVIFD